MAGIDKWLSGNQADLESGLREAIAHIFGVATELDPTDEYSIFKAAANGIIQGAAIQDQIPDMLQKAVVYFSETLTPILRKPALDILDNLKKNGVITQQVYANFTKMFASNNLVSTISIYVSLLSVIAEYVKGNSSISMAIKQRELAQSLRPFLPDAASVMNAAFIDPSAAKRIRKILAENGITEDDINLLFKAQYRSYDEGTIRSLYFRGALTDDEVYNRMRELHYTDKRTEEIIKSWSVLPGPQDVIRYAVREAFSDQQSADLGLDERYPGELTEWGKKIGMPEQVLKYEWRSHWELMPLNMAFDALHRGLLTDDDITNLLIAHDYSPRWHEALKGIAYNIVTRVDARRLYEKGIWDDAKLLAWYKKAGYTDDDAHDMTAWSKLEYGQQDKEASLGTILDGYQNGIIPRSDAERLIKSLGYTDDRVAWLLNLSDYKDAADSRRQIISGVKKLYVDGQIDQLEVRQRLGLEGVDAQYIEALLLNWNAEIVTNEKIPTKGDVDRFFRSKIYDESQYKEALKKIGYNETDISAYVKLNAPKEP